MVRIYLVRHGKDSTCGDLTRPGIRQCREAGKFLKEELKGENCKVFSSTYKRAKQTARIIAKIIGHDGEICYTKNLREVGLRESNEAIRKRVNEFKKELLKILESDEDSPIVITAHSRSIRELVRALLNKKDRRKVMLAPKHASINCIEFDGQNFSYSKENGTIFVPTKVKKPVRVLSRGFRGKYRNLVNIKRKLATLKKHFGGKKSKL